VAPAALGAEQGLLAARYASWGRRAVAYTLDALIVFVALMLAIAALVGVTAAIGSTAAENVAIGVTLALVFVGPGVYYVYFVGNERGQTYGRRALGIQVRDGETHGPIGYGRSFGRYAIVFVFGLLTFPLIVDYLWPLWDRRNRTLHDKMVGSVVLDIRPGVEERPRKELAVRRGWTVGRAAIVAGAAVVGALAVGRLGVAVNHTLADSIKDGWVFFCGAIGGGALGAAVGFAVFGWRLGLRGALVVLGAAAVAALVLGGLVVLGNQEDTSSGEELFTETFSDEWMFAVGAMMGAAGGALIGGLAFLIWASRRVRKLAAPVGDAAQA
jgi:uncharacterized RDD family membrane protein YckC